MPDVIWDDRKRKGYKPKYKMDGILPQVEHLANLAGGSLQNIAIGTDLDGGVGAELAPLDVDTIADVANFGAVLQQAGYSEEDARGVLSGNALRFLRQAWQGWNEVSPVKRGLVVPRKNASPV